MTMASSLPRGAQLGRGNGLGGPLEKGPLTVIPLPSAPKHQSLRERDRLDC